MNISVRQITNSTEWLAFVKNQVYTLFVQLPSYGSFYESLGEKSWIFGIYQNEILVGGSLVVSTKARRGHFLYLPYGPILPEEGMAAALEIFTNTLSNFAKNKKFHFLRYSPYINENPKTKNLFAKLGFRNAPMHMLAETTWLLDLRQSEEKLLASMKKNHRNLIHRCIRDGVKIEIDTTNRSLDLFHTMHDETAKRHNFHRFSRDYIEKEFSAFAKSSEVALFKSFLPDGRLDATAIIMYTGSMAAYRHGASYGLDSRLPTSYLLQWNAILEAKKRGCDWYNFWGIAPAYAPTSHPFSGITHFKKGFGGFQKDLLSCHDLPLSWRYWVNWSIEKIRSIRRGFN